MKSKPRFTLLQFAIFIGAWLPLVILIFDYFTGNLGVNPIQSLEQRLGRTALTFLTLSLACTPVHTLTGWSEPLKRSRALGLYAFMYACLHLTTFLWLDYGFQFGLILAELTQKRYVFLGMLGFIILLVLSVTSNQASKSFLRKNWKRLHKLVYHAAPLIILHAGLSKKGDFLRLQGDILRPAVYGLIVIVLLTLRLAPIRDYFKRHPLRLPWKPTSKKALNKETQLS